MRILPLLLPACASASTASTALSDRLVVGPDHEVAAVVDGRPALFAMRADGGYHPILNRSPAVPGRVETLHFSIGGRASSNYAFHAAAPMPSRLAGLIGPYTVPQRVVTFRLRPTVPGERIHALPLVNMHDDAVHENDAGLGTIVRVGRARVFVQWDLTRDGAWVTSATAPDLIEEFNAAFALPSQGNPHPSERTLVLARPLVVGPLRITNIALLHDATGAAPRDVKTADGTDIVVTARRRDPDARHVLSLGRDALDRCSSLTFDRALRAVVLSCLPA